VVRTKILPETRFACPLRTGLQHPALITRRRCTSSGHWTAHPNRLDRGLRNPFGWEGYAREELRAEIASLILGSELGIGYDPNSHAGYVDHRVQILTDKPKEIFYAAADAERISDYILTIEQKKEIQHTQEVGVMRDNIPHAERSYLVVPYAERQEAKALEARWDAVKKAWYVGPEADREKIGKWEPKHQPAPRLNPRTEFAGYSENCRLIILVLSKRSTTK
jgi:putative DNA primase/helicase